MKRIIAIMAAIILFCLPVLTSCSDKDSIPDGMQLASLEGEPFKLYVPKEMSLNTESGMSSAFAYVPDKFIISARYYTPSEPSMTLTDYMNYCANGYASSLEHFNMSALEPAVLSGVDALKMTYTAVIDSINYSCTQVSVLHKGDMISLNFYLPASANAAYSEVINSVTAEFVLCDKAEPINDEIVDKKTPDGMKIASRDILEYRLYVPKSWICNSESEKSEAYYPESEKTNVTVTSYSPSETMNVAGYIALCEENYAKSIKGYELVEKADIKVASKDAIAMTFKANYDGIDFKIKQVSLVYEQMVYSITYSATAEKFDSHLADFEKMISEFTFR